MDLALDRVESKVQCFRGLSCPPAISWVSLVSARCVLLQTGPLHKEVKAEFKINVVAE